MIPFDDFKKVADAIPYQYRHPHFLYALVKWLRPKSVVEIGTHLGMSAVWMARGIQENGEGVLTCIDNFCWAREEQELAWRRNVVACGVHGTVRLVVGRSQEVAWPATVDMAYIDGNHTYEVCKHDYNKACDLGASCIIFNDTATCDGVQRLTNQLKSFTDHHWHFLEVNFDAGLLVCIKREFRPAPQQGDYDPWDKPAMQKDIEEDHNFHDLGLRDS